MFNPKSEIGYSVWENSNSISPFVFKSTIAINNGSSLGSFANSYCVLTYSSETVFEFSSEIVLEFS